MSDHMARKVVPIGDNTFYIRRFQPFIGIQILGDLQKRFLGPLMDALSMGGVVENGDSVSLETLRKSVQTDSLKLALRQISANLSGADLLMMVKQLLQPDYISVEQGGVPGEAVKLTENMIALTLPTSAKVLYLCLEVIKHNYSDFFESGIGPAGAP